jgi:hypothetical protein
MDMDPQILLNATEAFMLSMRRHWVAAGGQGDCPVKPLDGYPQAQRQALMRSIAVAVATANTPKKP